MRVDRQQLLSNNNEKKFSEVCFKFFLFRVKPACMIYSAVEYTLPFTAVAQTKGSRYKSK